MTYELAKRLKEAGYPQKGTWENHEGLRYWSTYDGGASRDKPEPIDGSEANFGFMEDLYYIPTLEQLIEACGDKFENLAHVKVKYRYDRDSDRGVDEKVDIWVCNWEEC